MHGRGGLTTAYTSCKHWASFLQFSDLCFSTGYWYVGKLAIGQSACGKSNLCSHFACVHDRDPVCNVSSAISLSFMLCYYFHTKT